MPTALILLAPGFEEVEAITIIDLLRRAAIDVTVAGMEEGLISGSHQIRVQPDIHFSRVNVLDYDVLILPGGQPGTRNLMGNPKVLEWVRERFTEGKKLAAICAAPTVFHAAGITKGLKLTSYPSEESVFTDSIYLKIKVVRDKNVITSRGVGTAIDFSLAIIEELQGGDVAKDVARRILFEDAN